MIDEIIKAIKQSHDAQILSWIINKFGTAGKIEIPINEIKQFQSGGICRRGSDNKITLHAFSSDEEMATFEKEENKKEDDIGTLFSKLLERIKNK